MKAAIYARFSTDKQSESSIDDQVRVCERLAERERFEVVARFDDRGISGGTSKRPGYQRLLDAARREEFQIILAEDLKRLWREQAEQWRAIKELLDLNIAVVTASGIDSRQPNFEMIASVIGAAAELDRKEAGYRTRRGQEGRAIAGESTGGKAYGYVSAKDSPTSRVAIDPVQAAIVRRIFEMYAEGHSPRAIAAMLNAEGVPSPGSSWGRQTRRKSGWLASAIHGDVERGTGILNNRRYIGIIAWGRTHWKRGAADSTRRRMFMNAKPTHIREDERLRIVPQELWNRVKARQVLRRETVGARVKGALRRRAPGQGRRARHLFSGLLRCGECGANFTLADSRSYACASYVNGAACSNKVRVTRALVESKILASVRTDLLDPDLIAEVDRRYRRALKIRKPDASLKKRAAELERQVANLAEAIADGRLRSSPALADRLAAAESELARVQATQRQPAPIVALTPRLQDRYRDIVARLDTALTEDPDRAKSALLDALGSPVTLEPDPSRKFLWAEYGLEAAPLLKAAGVPEFMVAGAGFEPATFGL